MLITFDNDTSNALSAVIKKGNDHQASGELNGI